jgi:hypothetical protein
MRLSTASRAYLLLDVEIDADPSAAAIELFIGGEWPPMSWVGPAVALEPGAWTRTAKLQVAGPDAEPAEAVVLAKSTHKTAWRLTGVGSEVTARSAESVVIQ